MVGGRGIPLGRAAPARRDDSSLLAATLDELHDLGPLPDQVRVHLDAGFDSPETRDELAACGTFHACAIWTPASNRAAALRAS